ncbi:MAG: Sir2 family NAD-dependent protein deacetylase [Planctomycetes bacterium]|nr:Sir2 family NAD-dependent protein deacetylase [Planctomycetota bacterium]
MASSEFGRAVALVRDARRIVALTGAGISTESGIPDFRGPGGSWTKYDPAVFAYPQFVGDPESRKAYWRWSVEFWPQVAAAKPNDAHLALVALERAERLRCVVTQNVDGLHGLAGSRDVIEIHGNGTRTVCLSCRTSYDRNRIQERLLGGDTDPRCEACGGVLKPDVVLFGERMPQGPTERAFDEAESCDLLIVVGSSLVVNPAARLVPQAKQNGAKVVIVNLDRTLYDGIADVVLRGRAAETMGSLVGEALST